MVTLHKSSASVAPDPGVYEVELVKYSDIQQMPSFDDPNKLVNKIFLTFAPVNFEYDPEEDSQDWNGVEFDVLFTVSLHKRANLSPVIAALYGVKSSDELPDDVDLESLKGRRINVTLGQTPGGYAKIEAAAPVRKKKKAAPVAQSNVFLEDDDE